MLYDFIDIYIFIFIYKNTYHHTDKHSLEPL